MKARIYRPLSVLSVAAALALGPLSVSAETPTPPAPSAAGEGDAGGGLPMHGGGMPMHMMGEGDTGGGMPMHGGGMPMHRMGEGDHSEMGGDMMDGNMGHMKEHMDSMMQDMMSGKDMSGHMQKMQAMMHHMMSMMASHVDDRLSSLKTDLKITDAQLPLWDSFADALRSAAKSMETTHHEKPQASAEKPASTKSGSDNSYPDAGAIKKSESPSPAEGAMHSETMQASASEGLPARLEDHEKRLTMHLAALKAIRATLDPLYASFNDEQKKIADGLMIGPMGVM